MFGNYSKLAGAIVGNLVGVAITYAAVKGVATCTDVGAVETCEVAGFTTAQVTGGVMFAINSLMVWAFPPNRPS